MLHPIGSHFDWKFSSFVYLMITVKYISYNIILEFDWFDQYLVFFIKIKKPVHPLVCPSAFIRSCRSRLILRYLIMKGVSYCNESKITFVYIWNSTDTLMFFFIFSLPLYIVCFLHRIFWEGYLNFSGKLLQ